MNCHCRSCLFFKPAGLTLGDGWSAGECHRRAPTPVERPSAGYGHRRIGEWPLVREVDHCGDYQPNGAWFAANPEREA